MKKPMGITIGYRKQRKLGAEERNANDVSGNWLSSKHTLLSVFKLFPDALRFLSATLSFLQLVTTLNF